MEGGLGCQITMKSPALEDNKNADGIPLAIDANRDPSLDAMKREIQMLKINPKGAKKRKLEVHMLD